MRAAVAALILLLGAGAGSATAAGEAAAPFLWRIASGGTTHYLQGSVHLLPEAAHPLPAALDAAYAAAEGLVFESDLAALSAPETQKRFLAAARAPKGLAAEVPAPLYARLQRHAAARSLPPKVCDPYRAWFCALSLELVAYAGAGFSAALGLDRHYHARARADGKTLAWLEAPDAHLALFTALSPRLGEALLTQVLDESEDPVLSPRHIYEAWRRGDTRLLESEIEAMRRDYPELHARLLADRNRAWLAILEPLLRGASPQLIVVGAAHLPGPDGLVPLLAARGFRIEPVTAPSAAAP